VVLSTAQTREEKERGEEMRREGEVSPLLTSRPNSKREKERREK
jgi:hypothetical protein